MIGLDFYIIALGGRIWELLEMYRYIDTPAISQILELWGIWL